MVSSSFQFVVSSLKAIDSVAGTTVIVSVQPSRPFFEFRPTSGRRLQLRQNFPDLVFSLVNSVPRVLAISLERRGYCALNYAEAWRKTPQHDGKFVDSLDAIIDVEFAEVLFIVSITGM